MSNYAQLLIDLARTLNREDLTEVLPGFVRMFEADVNRTLRVAKMVSRRTAQVGAAFGGFVPVPNDYLELQHIELIASPPVVLSALTKTQSDNLRRTTASGQPRHFNVTGTTFELIPPPSSEVTVEIAYYAKIIPLAEAEGGVNWLLTDAPDVYLYGSLIHSAPYLKDDARMPLWRANTDRIFADLQVADSRASFGTSPIRMRPRRAF